MHSKATQRYNFICQIGRDQNLVISATANVEGTYRFSYVVSGNVNGKSRYVMACELDPAWCLFLYC